MLRLNLSLLHSVHVSSDTSGETVYMLIHGSYYSSDRQEPKYCMNWYIYHDHLDVKSRGSCKKLTRRDHSFLFICVNINLGKNVMSTIFETMIFSSFLCTFVKY